MDTNQPFVITISRELGSGGRTIGRKLAAQLNVRYIKDLMEKFKLTTYEIERIKGKKKNWLADFLEAVAPVPNSGAFVGFDPIKGNDWNNSSVKADDIFEAESDILRGIADEGSCVLAGRSGSEESPQQSGHFHSGSPGKTHRPCDEETGAYRKRSPRGHRIR